MSGGDAATETFVQALRTAQAALREVPGKLEGARVHDFAFGKLFEATEVRDAYHNRLPETEKDITEACEVIAHFIAGLEGGHSIGGAQR
jgi:ATP-dependent Clp protease ATP-binding subunit ClpA